MDLQHRGSDQGSPYIRGDIALVPPSPDLAPSSNFESAIDFSASLGSPPFLDNTGSFHNSPYSGHSELSFVTADNDLSFELFSGDEGASGLFDTIGSAGLGSANEFDYDPAEYDPPHSGASVMMFSDNDYMSPPPTFDGIMGSASPDHHQRDHRSGSVPYDYSSPSSNTSANDDGNDRRSRASSVSSAHRAQQQNQYYHSPRLDVAQSFENMTVRSPNWGVQQLPGQVPQHKAPSPPRLVMPDNQDPPPTINAPDGDDMDGGPQLHIVPATPIGLPGGGVAGAPFQNTLDTLNQGAELGSNQPSWGSGASETTSSRQPSPFRFPARGPNDGSSTADFANAINDNAPFLFPQQQRHRSKSDNALEPPHWDNAFVQQQLQHQGGDHSALGLDLDNVSSVDDSGLNTGSSTTSVNANASNSAGFNMQFQFGGGGNGFLSPDTQAFGMRRAKSESGNGRPGHRQSRSEDIRGLQQGGLQLPQQQHQQSQFLQHNNFHHGHSLSLSASQGQNMLFPPGGDFMSQPQNPNLLSTHTLPPIRSGSPGLGHIRRASSGSRAGRGIGAESWLAEYGSSANSARASPYPSPNASPHVRYGELELDLEVEQKVDIPGGVPSAGFENEVALSGRMGLNAASKQQQQQVGQGVMDVKGFLGAPGMGTMTDVHGLPAVVSKPNVTTLRTANASHKRRKQEASFRCPFPGCGSTFTRSFNLKGHIRSHNEEKPFVCHWPGCNKGFARQHDCKRHEQLHTNYRPFTCEGCNRQFARMDALNRHLRSEGGAECAKTQSQATGSNASTPAAQSPPPSDGQSPPGRSHSRQGDYSNTGSPNLNTWGMQAGGKAVGVSL